MTNGDDDTSMLELFRGEVKIHVATLKEVLSQLSGAQPDIKKVEAALRAVHSLRGAARIVQLELVADLASAMESFLTALKEGTITASDKDMAVLLEGTQFLSAVVPLSDEEIVVWMQDHEEQCLDLIKSITGLSGKEAPKKPKEKAKAAVSPEAGFFELLDPEVLMAFCKNVSAEVKILNDGLLILDHEPSKFEELEALLAAARALQDSARSINLTLVIKVAKALEKCFTRVQKALLSMTHEDIDALLHGVDLIGQTVEVPCEELAAWQENFAKDADTMIKAIGSIGGEETPEVRPEKPLELSIDTSMLDLFRIEVETQVAVLNEGLLAVERGESSEEMLASLMRAAHSIKGASRVVGIDPLVGLSHAMEDCFVAAQEGRLIIDEDKIDFLLKGVDMLLQVSKIEDDRMTAWLEDNNALIVTLTTAYGAILAGKTPEPLEEQRPRRVEVPKAKPTARAETVAAEVLTKKPPKKEPPPSAAEEDRVLRVTAQSLNRLMGLAGESLVESRWLQPFGDSLLLLKKQQNELASIVDFFREALKDLPIEGEVQHYLMELQHKANECRQQLTDRISELEGFIRQHANLSDRLYREVINSRMRPFSDGVQAFPRLVRDLARQMDKKAKLEIIGKTTSVDRDILEKLEAPLNHLLRNAIDHGIEAPKDREKAGKPREGSVKLEARHRAGMLAITVSDDGHGIDVEQLRNKVVSKNLASAEMAAGLSKSELLEFLYLPGFSTAKKVTEVSGRGVGLDVVQSMVQEVGGLLRTDTQPGKGVTVSMQLPLTLSVIRALIAEISHEPYAFPLARIDRVINVAAKDIEVVENRQYFSFEEQNIGLIPGYQVLELEATKGLNGEFSVIVISDRNNVYGVAVDRIFGERELVVQELERVLGKVPDISSGALMESGEPVLIIDVEDVVKSIDNILRGGRLRKLGAVEEKEGEHRVKRVLVIDDSITVREVECRLLRNQGYEVETAVDGMDGWNAVRLGKYDLIVTDVDMPRMDGIELVKAIRSDEKLKDIPIIIVSYKDREEDRMAGMEAGADYYLTKSSFHDETLIEVVEDLVGKPVT